MVWGLLVAAGAALLMGAYTHTPAKAADLGGDCCSDLEDRVAELEATTVRKGNKKVSVTLYGQVNKAVLWWDDHVESNTYSVDNNYESSRFGLKGSAKITGDWSAGYRLEVETTNANSTKLNQFNDDNANDPQADIGIKTQVTGSDVTDWFIALDQDFESAAFHLYAAYQHFDDPTLSLIDVTRTQTHVPLKLDGFDLGYIGGRMYF